MLGLAFLPFVLLPLIAGVIAIRRAWGMVQGAGQTGAGRWILLTMFAALLPLLTHYASQAVWTVYDCTGGKTFEGCNDASDSLGTLIYSLTWLGVLTFIPALVIGTTLTIVALFLFIWAQKRSVDAMNAPDRAENRSRRNR